mmetsp:Transcript_28579/g.84148  ORF Transcript_28579/g.84148 Transcript_28579/m.84148 type:complete len:559 (-) Transcript_28579:144-1820(-)
MSNKGEDLFGDSSSDGGDTDDLLAEASSKPAATKKAGAKKLGGADKKRKRDVPDADFDDSDDDDDDDADAGGGDDDAGAGLFDSDDSDDDDAPAKKSKKLKKKKAAPKKKAGKKSKKGGDGGGKKKMSKKEKMAALAQRKRALKGDVDMSGAASGLAEDDERRKNKGDDSDGGDSYDSREFVRTKEDDDFIDADDEDPEALEELYREQHFDDERPDGSDSEDDQGRKVKKHRNVGRKVRSGGPDSLSDFDLKGEEPPDNPIMAAVHKMKRKKKEVKKLSELEDEAREFLRRMEQAAEEDEQAVAERRPGTKKLKMLTEVLNMLTKQNMMRPLLDHDLLTVCRRWIQPLPKGGLGNVTLRQKLLQAIGNLSGENGVTPNDLKRSGFGKTVMALYMHKSETPPLKRQHKEMIERWSRPIFQKSGNMRDLEKAHSIRANRAEMGIAGYARAAAVGQAGASPGRDESRGRGRRDVSSIISGGDKSAKDSVNNRVRVPFSKGFQFTKRPVNRMAGDARDNSTVMAGGVKGQREGLHKRMIEKGRPVNKNQRSANISIEGRPTK